MKRIAVFIDGSNFKSACNLLDIRPDYNRLKEYLAHDGDVVGYYYFTALPPADIDSNLRKLTDFLQYNGWLLKTKETKSITDPFGGPPKIKGNMDIEIVTQAFRMCEYISDLYLFSGDGDFSAAIEELQARGLRVTAFSVLRRDGTNMTGDDLRRQVNAFVNLADIADHIRMLPHDERTPSLKFLHRTE